METKYDFIYMINTSNGHSNMMVADGMQLPRRLVNILEVSGAGRLAEAEHAGWRPSEEFSAVLVTAELAGLKWVTVTAKDIGVAMAELNKDWTDENFEIMLKNLLSGDLTINSPRRKS